MSFRAAAGGLLSAPRLHLHYIFLRVFTRSLTFCLVKPPLEWSALSREDLIKPEVKAAGVLPAPEQLESSSRHKTKWWSDDIFAALTTFTTSEADAEMFEH